MTVAAQPYSTTVPVYVVTALGEVGEHEVAGGKSNARIVEYLATTTLPASGRLDETPWCSAFINWCMLQSGYRGTNSAAALSWLNWGKPVQTPRLGTLAVLWRDDPDSGKGHVGIVIRKRGSGLWLLSGNQGNQVSIAEYPVARLKPGGYREP